LFLTLDQRASIDFADAHNTIVPMRFGIIDGSSTDESKTADACSASLRKIHPKLSTSLGYDRLLPRAAAQDASAYRDRSKYGSDPIGRFFWLHLPATSLVWANRCSWFGACASPAATSSPSTSKAGTSTTRSLAPRGVGAARSIRRSAPTCGTRAKAGSTDLIATVLHALGLVKSIRGLARGFPAGCVGDPCDR
jgi:hypothetical protein